MSLADILFSGAKHDVAYQETHPYTLRRRVCSFQVVYSVWHLLHQPCSLASWITFILDRSGFHYKHIITCVALYQN